MIETKKMILKQEIRKRFEPIINSWNDGDIYTISFYVYDLDDNPCRPTVALGYNTERQVVDNLKWTDEQEARWNYAFWLQNEVFVFGRDDGTENIVSEWILDNDFTHMKSGSTYDNNLGDECLMEELKITNAFVSILILIIQELHDSSFIKNKFGKEIPIIIHELEYYNIIAKQNIDANGVDLIRDFVEFCG